MKLVKMILFVCLTAWVTSCQSSRNIPDDLTASQLIQHGQNASDLGFYRKAERYYTCAVERYGTDGKVYVESRYELGHLHIKMKQWQKGYEELREIVQMYEGSVIGQSPVSPTYYKIAKMSLDKIPENKLPKIEATILKEQNAREAKARANAEKEAAKAAKEEEAAVEYTTSGEPSLDGTDNGMAESAGETDEMQGNSGETAGDASGQ